MSRQAARSAITGIGLEAPCHMKLLLSELLRPAAHRFHATKPVSSDPQAARMAGANHGSIRDSSPSAFSDCPRGTTVDWIRANREAELRSTALGNAFTTAPGQARLGKRRAAWRASSYALYRGVSPRRVVELVRVTTAREDEAARDEHPLASQDQYRFRSNYTC